MSSLTAGPVPPARSSTNELQEQIERILASAPFRGTETLRRLLSYLAAHAMSVGAEPPTVHEIARDVFGRRNFDAHSDSVVRAHTGRLRLKLAEYYIDEGARDTLLVSIPKGGYSLTWCSRRVPDGAIALEEPGDSRPRPRPALRAYTVAVLLGAVAALAVVGAIRAPSPEGAAAPASASSKVSPALAAFWKGFAGSREPTLVVFCNLTPPNLTTMGEVLGVADVTRTLCLLHKDPVAKAGRFLSWDDARTANLVFVGGPFAETPLREFGMFQEFQFRKGAPAGADGIVNVHALKGEAAFYPRSWPASPMDYGVIALRPGFTPGRYILALAGITEYGTIAAAETVSREELAARLLGRLGVKNSGAVPFFEALCKVKVIGGAAVEPEIMLVHPVR